MSSTNPSSCCMIVPPHLLQAIARSDSCSQHSRSAANDALEHALALHRVRRSAFGGRQQRAPQHGGIVPSYVHDSIAQSDQASSTSRQSAAGTLRHQQQGGAPVTQSASGVLKPVRQICDARHSSNEQTLPGLSLRNEGQPSTQVSDKAANDTYDNLGKVFDFYADVFARNSIDGAGMSLIGSIHFGQRYGNAFWNGAQMVFGDGDGELLYNFTSSLDVIGHELTHGVTENTAKLAYEGQSGALNESVSDVFGVTIRQFSLGQTAAQADWLVGEDCILPDVKGVALRSLKAPGTAYDDPRFGKDPQPATMAGYVDTQDDNGGVHTNSGIPNHAFYLVATGLGGNSWEKACPIWYQTLLSNEITPNVDFKGFANITVALAKSMFGSSEQGIVSDAWRQVGVL